MWTPLLRSWVLSTTKGEAEAAGADTGLMLGSPGARQSHPPTAPEALQRGFSELYLESM